MFAPARHVFGAVRIAERGTRRIGEAAQQLSLGALDVALGSALARAAVEKVVASALAEHAIESALRGPLVEAVAGDLTRHRVLERVVDPLLRDGIVDALADRVTSGPELERIVSAAADTPAARRLVANVIASGVADEALARLLETEELWVLVDEVARSPSVTDAISHQSAGLADQMAEVVRHQSRSADARLERAARRMLGREARTDGNGVTTPDEE